MHLVDGWRMAMTAELHRNAGPGDVAERRDRAAQNGQKQTPLRQPCYITLCPVLS